MRIFWLVGTVLLSRAACGPAVADPILVSTVYGVYDANSCGNGSGCLNAQPGQPLAGGYGTNGGSSYDTPSLFINNNTGYAFSNVSFALAAYQGINAGSTTVIPAGTIASNSVGANTLYQLIWSQNGGGTGNAVPASGSNPNADLFTYDYDDYYNGNLSNPACIETQFYCAYVGNFDVTFTATWDNPAYGVNGTPIYAQFSPDNTQGPGNAAGVFVGWEGLDSTGLSETIYDNHSGAESGVLADIYVGTPTTVPEPGSLILLSAGLAVLGVGWRSRVKEKLFLYGNKDRGQRAGPKTAVNIGGIGQGHPDMESDLPSGSLERDRLK